MLIDNLNIQCFRGIPDSLSLDLTAPLTVLYAPNGTGKTSVCDAVEWVLCGGVGRLDKDNNIRCILGDENLETSVEANIPQNGTPFFIKRSLSASSTPLFWKDNECDYIVATDQELLRRFVKALPPSGNSNKAKVDWVRSTRFLESDSLRLLIDSDKESNDTRKLIFSNLFGVAEYQKNERDLSRILKRLPKGRIEKGIKDSIKKIAEYEGLIGKLTAEQTAPYKDHAFNLLNKIAEHLGQEKDTDSNIDTQEYYKSLEVKHIQCIESLAEQSSSLLSIRENIGLYRDHLSNSEVLNKTIKDNITAQETLNENLTKKKAAFIERQDLAKKREVQVHEVSVAIDRIKTERATWYHLYDLYKNPPLEVDDSKNRSSGISNHLATTEQQISTLNEKLLSVDNHIKLLPEWLRKYEKIKGINIELEALQTRKPNKVSETPLAEQASKLKSELDAKQASREKVLGEIELLLSSGKRYVETHLQDSECPLCEYQHESNTALQEKINARFSKLSSKSKEEAALTSKFDAITQLLMQESTHLKKFEELTVEKNLLAKSIQETGDGFVALGIDKSYLTQPENMSDKLGNIQLQYQSSIQKLTQDVVPYKSAYDAAKKIRRNAY